jgi:hypothetical protein
MSYTYYLLSEAHIPLYLVKSGQLLSVNGHLVMPAFAEFPSDIEKKAFL